MQMFEYIIVLISIVIGLALTHLMQGIAGLIQHPERSRVWWVHLVWIPVGAALTVAGLRVAKAALFYQSFRHQAGEGRLVK